MARVIVQVEGGVVSAAYSDIEGLKVVVVDFDELAEEAGNRAGHIAVEPVPGPDTVIGRELKYLDSEGYRK